MSATIEIGLTSSGEPWAVTVLDVSSDGLLLRVPGQEDAAWMDAEDLRRAAEQREDRGLRLTWAPVWAYLRRVWAQRQAEAVATETEVRRRAAEARRRAAAAVRACTHESYEVEAELPYSGSVVGPDGEEVRAAHGNVCLRDRCKCCGAARHRNVNVGEEIGRWHVDETTVAQHC